MSMSAEPDPAAASPVSPSASPDPAPESGFVDAADPHRAADGPPISEGAAPVLVADLPGKVLATKEGETFIYSDMDGDLRDRYEVGVGFYHRDTRFLSHLHMRIMGREPVLLSSSAERAFVSYVDLTNPPLYEGDRLVAPQQTLNFRRIRAVGDGRLFEKVRIKNYNPFPVRIVLEFSFGADFADIFEVRGMSRTERGHFDPPRADRRSAEFSHLGRDGVRRVTRIAFGPAPRRLGVRGDLVEADFEVEVPAHATSVVSYQVDPILDGQAPESADLDTTLHHLRRSYEGWERESTTIRTDNALFDQLLQQGLRDLRALYTRMDGGGIIAAGIPWYVAPFGRDSLISAHQMLMVNARPARETLRLLAAFQGTEMNDWRDEEPGKILHEIRRGELAGSGQVPHTPYYGSIDSTPWFLILLAQYYRWTADLGLVKELLPAAEAGLAWMDRHGDLDGDGFLEYRGRSERGLANHGWKDSWDSIVHEDGSLAEPPIALSEVQAYAFLAKTRMADVFAGLGDYERAVSLRDQATVLKKRFNDAFWLEEEGFYALALDGEKRPVRTTTSNPGHALYCAAVEGAKAEQVARRLFQPDMFSGWGIRTMSKNAGPYNPMSYHNGSVWPHDNALIAAGLKRYGFAEATNRVASALFDAAVHMDYLRLPELYCGFVRRPRARPVQYPVACSPQAWAAGAPFFLLQAMLGLSARANENLLTVNKPHLPKWLNEVELRGLRVGKSRLSLVFRRERETTGFSLLSKEGDVRVVMEE